MFFFSATQGRFLGLEVLWCTTSAAVIGRAVGKVKRDVKWKLILTLHHRPFTLSLKSSAGLKLTNFSEFPHRIVIKADLKENYQFFSR